MKRFVVFVIGLVAHSASLAATEVTARLEWLERVELRAVETGVVEEVKVTVGERVQKDDLLVLMDQRDANARLLKTKAQVARAKLDQQSASRELERASELFDRGLIAAEGLKQAELRQAVAQADVESTHAAEVAARITLERTELRAPFAGIVVARNVWPGEVVYASLQQEPLVVVAPADRMLARALVGADMLRSNPPGRKIKVEVLGELRDARIYSRGVEPVRVELKGAVYELDAIFKVRRRDILRPSESAQIILP